MSRRETTATPPLPTRVLAGVLPAPLRFVACLGVHTIPAGHGNCAVCGRDWSARGRRRWLAVRAHRTPHRRGAPSRIAVHVSVLAGLGVHRGHASDGRSYWALQWRWRADTHTARLRPTVSFAHANISARCRAEQAERDRPDPQCDGGGSEGRTA